MGFGVVGVEAQWEEEEGEPEGWLSMRSQAKGGGRLGPQPGLWCLP